MDQFLDFARADFAGVEALQTWRLCKRGDPAETNNNATCMKLRRISDINQEGASERGLETSDTESAAERETVSGLFGASVLGLRDFLPISSRPLNSQASCVECSIYCHAFCSRMSRYSNDYNHTV